MSGIVNAATKAAVEGFVGTTSSERRRDAYVDFLAAFIGFVVAIVLLGFIGKYLWNYVVVDMLTIAKPVKSFWQIIGFMLFVSLIRP